MLPLVLGLSLILAEPDVPVQKKPLAATVVSTLPTAGDHIRQYAFDSDAATAYTTDRPPAAGDSVTLIFDEPVVVGSVSIKGRGLDGGTIEGSTDGQAFEPLTGVQDGGGKAEPRKSLKAVRFVPAKDAKEPLEIVEISVDSNPAVHRFAFPVEFVVDEVDEPELKPWAEKAARECEKSYDLINEALKSDGYTPARVVHLSIKNGIDVPAYASGSRITGSAKWFKDHPDDVGAMIHESTHVVQRYRGRRNPGWLVEGVADYVRFVLYEPANIGRLNVKTARHDQSYRVTARFLDYVSRKYDKDFVLKLNRAMREGKYSEDLFKESTGKTLDELGTEWKDSLTQQ